MTDGTTDEEQGRQWLQGRDVPRGTLDAINAFIVLLRKECEHQNLIARSTFDQIWFRHVVDSAQLLEHAPDGNWVDIGSGAGFPGMIVALLSRRTVTLVEPRARRAAFLNRCISELGLQDRVEVKACNAQVLTPERSFAVISARAVAGLSSLLNMAIMLAGLETVWILPKGRSAADELAVACRSWQGDFELKPSLTDPQASIVVARHVRPRNSR